MRTNTDLATMEGANEAARRAVNAILDRTGSGATRCAIYTLPEPAVLRAGAQARRAALAAVPPAARSRRCGSPADGDLEPAGLVSRAALGAGRLTRRLGR